MRYLILALFIVGISPAHARPPTASEKAAIQVAMDGLTAALLRNDIVGVMRTTPRRVLDSMASQAGLPPEEFLKLVEDQAQNAISGVTFSNMHFDIEAIDITDSPEPDRPAISYGVFPSDFEIEVDGARYRQDTEYLALKDGGRWYIVRIAEVPQLLLLQAVYPSLSRLTTANTSAVLLSE